MSKLDSLLNRVEFFNKLALYGNRKDFLTRLAQEYGEDITYRPDTPTTPDVEEKQYPTNIEDKYEVPIQSPQISDTHATPEQSEKPYGVGIDWAKKVQHEKDEALKHTPEDNDKFWVNYISQSINKLKSMDPKNPTDSNATIKMFPYLENKIKLISKNVGGDTIARMEKDLTEQKNRFLNEPIVFPTSTITPKQEVSPLPIPKISNNIKNRKKFLVSLGLAPNGQFIVR